MKKLENLGKNLGKKEQKQITGGGLITLYCYTPGGGGPVAVYPDSASCDAGLKKYCHNPPYVACACSDDTYDTLCP